MPVQIYPNLPSTLDEFWEYITEIKQAEGTIEHYIAEFEKHIDILIAQFNVEVEDFHIFGIFLDGISSEAYSATKQACANSYLQAKTVALAYHNNLPIPNYYTLNHPQ
jgi:hypothetical protein